jgi:hypothetical protein
VTRHHGGLTPRGLLHHLPLRLTNCGRATLPRPVHLHMVLLPRVDACSWRAQQLLGALGPSLPQEGAFAGQAPGGYCRCSRYRGIPIHLLLGPFNGPALAQGWNNDRSPAEKTLMRRRLMRSTTAKTAKDQKTSSRAFSRAGRDHVHVSAVRFRAEQEDRSRRLRTIHATPDR